MHQNLNVKVIIISMRVTRADIIEPEIFYETTWERPRGVINTRARCFGIPRWGNQCFNLEETQDGNLTTASLNSSLFSLKWLTTSNVPSLLHCSKVHSSRQWEHIQEIIFPETSCSSCYRLLLEIPRKFTSTFLGMMWSMSEAFQVSIIIQERIQLSDFVCGRGDGGTHSIASPKVKVLQVVIQIIISCNN